MKQNRIALACVLSGLLASAPLVGAFTSDNPYVGTITNRNLFGLKPPPDPGTLNPPPPAPPLPNVLLSGITTLMGNPRACLRVPRAAKPPEPAKEISLFLSAGGPAEEGVQVLEINVAAGTVKINNNGIVQDLDITKNAPKSAGAPPAPGGGAPPPPPVPNGAIPVPHPKPAITSFDRPVRGSGPGANSGPAVGSGQAPVASAETAPVRIPSNEEQTWTLALQRERDLQLISEGKMHPSDLPPYPPSEVTEMADKEAQEGANGQNSGPPKF